jgi:DNA segregation ATPase FtsK/SpoIIIE-like protein
VIDEADSIIGSSQAPVRKAVTEYLSTIVKQGGKFGLHLVLCSQRPSGDLISPHILANISARVCLKVAKDEYSENVINIPDAARLGGKGDLIWQFEGENVRAQGFYISPDELERLMPAEPIHYAEDSGDNRIDFFWPKRSARRSAVVQDETDMNIQPEYIPENVEYSPEKPEYSAEYDEHRPVKGGAPREYSEADQIKALHDAGTTIQAISRELGLPYSRVQRTLSKARE